MAFIENRIGSLTDVYTDTQYQAGSLPRVGDWYFDEERNAKFIFLKLSTGTLDAKEVAVSAATERAFSPVGASPTPTCKKATAANNLPFAGVRVVGATQMTTTNCYGWLQISGGATFIADAAGTTADSVAVSSNATAGSVETISSTYAVTMGPGVMIGLARTTTTAGDAVVDITSNCWGI